MQPRIKNKSELPVAGSVQSWSINTQGRNQEFLEVRTILQIAFSPPPLKKKKTTTTTL